MIPFVVLPKITTAVPRGRQAFRKHLCVADRDLGAIRGEDDAARAGRGQREAQGEYGRER